MRISVRQTAICGMLGGLAIFLGVSGLGFIPVPTPAQHATIMHVPVIIGAVFEGPWAATFIGGIFGVYSFLNASSPFFADPLVSILPRLLIGFVAYGAFRLLGSGKIAVAGAAIAGTVANTVFVMGMIALRGYLPWKVALAVGLTNGIPEIVVALFVVLGVYPVVKRIPAMSSAGTRRGELSAGKDISI